MVVLRKNIAVPTSSVFLNSNSSGSLASRAIVRNPRPAPLLSSGASLRERLETLRTMTLEEIRASYRESLRSASARSSEIGFAHSRK